MTETFKASNGRQIDREPGSVVRIWEGDGRLKEDNMLNGCPYLNERDVEALREFFQHERDQELGRWRWPEDPDYVVYLDRTRRFVHQPAVLVVNERDGGQAYVSRDGELSAFGVGARDGSLEHAANAYFAAHPESKPWQEAKEGEVWVVRVPDNDLVMTVHESEYGGLRFRRNDRHGTIYALDTPSIREGRRIWPEVSDA